MGRKELGLVFWVVALTTSALAQQEIASQLDAQFRDKTLTMRQWPTGKKLHFDANAALREGGKPGPWAVDAMIHVDRVTATATGLAIHAARVGVLFPRHNAEMSFLKGDDVVLAIDLPAGADIAATNQIFKKIFLNNGEPLANIVPDSWKDLLGGQIVQMHPVRQTTVDGTPVANTKAGSMGTQGDISAPRAVEAPDPEYEPIAWTKNLQGTVVLWCVVSPEGRADNVKIVAPLGLGLDDRAVAAVSRWRFKPARRQGMPVPVGIILEVGFQKQK